MDMVSMDVDKLFYYDTRAEVNIQDPILGLMNNCVFFGVIAYIIFGIFISGQGYLDFEQARGAIATHVRGDAVANSIGKPGKRYFTAEEITYPGLENGNVFVATRQKVMRQQRGICEDFQMPCSSDNDCTRSKNGTCTGKGFCYEPAWCAVEEVPEIYELQVGDLFIWVKSAIQFVRLARDKVYSTEDNHPDPKRGFNLFSVRDLLTLCKPVPVRFEEISELGAAIEVQFIWNCNVDKEECEPEVSARRVDVLFDPKNIGYTFNYAEEIDENQRMLNEMHGVRFFLRTHGNARKFSMTISVMKLATSITLLSLAPIFTDLLMLNVLGKRGKYKARKYEVSPDFSEHMEKIEALKKRKEDEKRDPEEEERKTREEEEDWQKRLNEEF